MKYLKLSTLVITLAAAAPSFAQTVTWNGHAAINGTAIKDRNSEIPSYGFSNDVNFEDDSVFALRANVDAGYGLTAAAEVMTRGADDFDVEMRWVYVGYNLSKNTFASAGSLRLPLMNYSDYLDVGMAYLPTALPRATYNLPDSYTGGSIAQNFRLNNYNLTIQALGGNLDGEVGYQDAELGIDSELMYGGTATLSSRSFMIRASYFDITDATLTAMPSNGTSSLMTTFSQEQDVSIYSAGFRFDGKQLLVEGEYVELDQSAPVTPEMRSGYMTVGYTFGQVTPFISWERRRDRKGYDVSTSESIRAMAQDSDTYSAGVRYNFHPNAAIKLNVSQINSPDSDLDSTLVSAGIAIKF
ncbi:porin [Idiomarina sp.]|uniref:porin n=1 Tax=Idiomarina sp. TaxID=1874361 RepID=UPI0025B7F6C6|nr:porin [Idiomarina sp.]